MSVLNRKELADSPLADLHQIAAELGVEGYRAMRKDDLIAAILGESGGAPGGGGAGAGAGGGGAGAGGGDGEPWSPEASGSESSGGESAVVVADDGSEED